jgi:hypothetical protein
MDMHHAISHMMSLRRELRDLPNAKLEHVRREFNSEADSLANAAMDSRRGTSEFSCPAGEEADAYGAAAVQSFERESGPKGSKVVIEID